MIEQNSNLKSKFRPRSTKKGEQSAKWTGAGSFDLKSNSFFDIERGNRFIRRFKLLFRDGRVISIPYAYLPVIIFDPARNLLIKTTDVEITIKGRTLNTLADWLSEEKVIWIKESESGVDDQGSEVFVSDIQIDGDLMM
jgi:hypothetical protein